MPCLIKTVVRRAPVELLRWSYMAIAEELLTAVRDTGGS